MPLEESEEEPPNKLLRRLSKPPLEEEVDLEVDELDPLRKVSSNSESKPPDFVSDLKSSPPTSTPILSNLLISDDDVEFPPNNSLINDESDDPENNPARKFKMARKIDLTSPLFLNVLNNDVQLMLEKIFDTNPILYWSNSWLPVMEWMMSWTNSDEVISLTIENNVLINALFSMPYVCSNTLSE